MEVKEGKSQVTRTIYMDIYNRSRTDMKLHSIDVRGGNLRASPAQLLRPGEMTKFHVVQGMSAWPDFTVKYSTVSPSYNPNLEVDAKFRGHTIRTQCKPGFRVDESHHTTSNMYNQNLYVGVSLI